MQIFNVDNLKGGWFCGAFKDTAYHTTACEVSYKTHPANEFWPAHYHVIADEVNYLISGEVEINGVHLQAPVVFVINKGEIVRPKFITDVAMVVVKIPGALNDKFIVD
jgi:hypothetical protein